MAMSKIERMAWRLRKGVQWLRLMLRRIGTPPECDVATSMDLCDDQIVAAILGRRPQFHSRLISSPARRVIGWGRKWSGRRAVALAARQGCGFLLLEDGFLRSLGRHDPPLSTALDDLGVHYDAGAPSRLETLITAPISACQRERTDKLIQLWRDARVSKYNAAPEYDGPLPANYILVVDQVRGDLSISCGGATAASFDAMLAAARAAHPDTDIVVKLHPDVFTNAAKSHFDPAQLQQYDRVHVIAENCHPVGLIAGAQAVYTVTSQLGFEALIWGKPVFTFGMPFYAGWGLTNDAQPRPDRRENVECAQLVHAALVTYVRYFDPVARKKCTAERAIAHVKLQRDMRRQLPAKIIGIGFSPWKRRFLKPFFAGSALRFATAVRAGESTAVWGNRLVSGNTMRVEDGFLRSVGLGAELTQPMSLVIDQTGIYYDATRPSDIETILNTQTLSAEQCARAQKLRRMIVASKMSKYNLVAGHWTRPQISQKVILVVGQVESDASLAFGSPEIRTNLGLLKRVRAMHPRAYIVFKPHPDVLAGLRDFGTDLGRYADHCDETLCQNVAPDQLFGQIDALHTMTSLMGFEALLRGVPVTCHGLPFYAGWGLTKDLVAAPHRTARLSLDGLVYGALITYPRYVDPKTGYFVQPEQILITLSEMLTLDSPNQTYHRLRRRLIRLGAQRKGRGK
ncbi:capsular polysaccharide export protein [Yoonia tamlensis]|uniref:Capsular polysaccharide export protein n=1 Tax=Yoonia tamlensis TaxID=390270 RepID=A0A1I6HF64_9RHOB|nr:capsular polysaccharide biosynthesis protein [Yoonia tamlensis]SFR53116.1 capsular polysaccharide export protein [Yoonia tamlensis]